MKKFLQKTWVYVIVVLLYVALGEYFLIRIQEVTPIEKVAEIQSTSKRELYYGRQVLGNSLSTYKYAIFERVQPKKVLVLGQSVTLQFRDFLFEPYEDEFYNTGLMARNIGDLNHVADLFESGEIQKPEFIFLGLDLSFVLKHTVLDKTRWIQDMPDDKALRAKSHLQGMQKLMLNARLRAKPEGEIGFGKAGMEGRGYRNDGTYRHKPEIEKYIQDSTYYDGELLQKLKERRLPFVEPFEYDDVKAERVLITLERFKNMGTELLIYVPAYSDFFFNEAIKDSMFAGFWQDFMQFQQVLVDKNYEVIIFTTPSGIGLTDNYMVDAEHPSEVMSAIQLRNYVRDRKESGGLLEQLTFRTVDSLLNNNHTIPISFLKDSISQSLKD
ncbi:hypothetical protein Oweho_1727 [Owenweeksia hongkongensis DSM 17368]|uniref:DUF1574 domain-containing protein n=1 Tax=Owenweeksia hongkongensis (strain DSM 17368 / CIP 108786 / JCM 12287 / NRRL B-23963 / UST20020801) TaxID=926562 RepID=G8R0L0_OWEHD|nr:hypothetical protein [Owenweeksia hongkongensis]AEV32714.1 hypothetical protein Oweho_1727 [Owenweeksia hongkongensis DSM 17368]